jgi:hypothetical protein
MDSRLGQGIIFFNAGRYFEAHEVWEDMWREAPPERRLFCQGLVQAAVGMHHRSKDNVIGARAQLKKALAKLDATGFDPEFDVERLRRDLRQVLEQLEVGGFPEVRIVGLKSNRSVVESERTLE